MNHSSEVANALLTAWYPGEQGGQAIASIIFGDANPSGRLPVSIPRSTGQLPIYYSQGKLKDYVDESSTPLYPFGYGLSYTKFDYSDLSVTPCTEKGDSATVAVTVRNSGEREGDEVVQMYIADKVASVAQPQITLRGFEKVNLKAGESRRITFTLGFDELSIINADMKRVIEPGDFDIMIGASSQDIRLKDKLTVK